MLNACPNATLSQVRKQLITHKQDVDEAIEALYEAEYQTASHQDDSMSQPNLELPGTDEVASLPDQNIEREVSNEVETTSQESGVDEKRKRKRIAARDRKMENKMKQKQKRKAKAKAEEEQQEAKVTSELRQLYI